MVDPLVAQPWRRANEIMIKWGFPHQLILRSHIWAAKHRECPKCMVPPGFPCHNMSDVKKGLPVIRSNLWPHTDRVDWALLERTLREKGYV